MGRGYDFKFYSFKKTNNRDYTLNAKKKRGRAINITGPVEPREVNIANAAKSAVHAWAKGLSRVVAKDGITVNSISPGRLKTEQILKLAVKRMLPDGPLAKQQLTKLKIYNGDKHPHEIQKPKVVNFEKLNKRNIAR